MSRILLILIFLVETAEATAKVGFHCYAFTTAPAQTYEYASGNCGSVDSKSLVKSIGKNTLQKNMEVQKEILCMYQAGCLPVEGRMIGEEPPQISDEELSSLFFNKTLKPSLLVCRGTGSVDQKALTDVHCPTPTECQKDIFYNFTISAAPNVTKRVSVPAQPENGVK